MRLAITSLVLRPKVLWLEAIAAEVGPMVDLRPVESDGAFRAAGLIAEHRRASLSAVDTGG